jgi:hypothetical protein
MSVTTQQTKIHFYKSKNDKGPQIKAYLSFKITNDTILWTFKSFDEILSANVSLSGTYPSSFNIVLVYYSILLEGMRWFSCNKQSRFLIYTDNIYICNVFNEWIGDWNKHSFMIAENKYRPHHQLLREIYSFKEKNAFSLTVNTS